MKKLAFTIAFLLAISPIAYSQISDLEKNALLDLHKSTNGTNWNTSWDLTKDVSEWHGITIENNTVTEINLTINNLTGPIPVSYIQLTLLTITIVSISFVYVSFPKNTTLIIYSIC